MTVSERQHAALATTGDDMELVTDLQASTDETETEIKDCQPLNGNNVKEYENEGALYSTPEKNTTTTPFFVRLRTEATFRHNLIQTALLCLSYGGYGWEIATMGPTLPDLQLITGEDLSTQSWIFTLSSVGYLTGSVLGGILYDRMCKTLLLAVGSAIMGLALVVLPFCSIFSLMLTVMTVIGLAEGIVDTGCNAHIVHIWGGDASSYMQAMHFAYSVGAMLSPLATAPFLAERTTNCPAFIRNSSEVIESSNNLTNSVYPLTNATLSTEIYSNLVSFSPNQTMEPHERCSETYEDIRVHYAFIIAAVMSFIPTAGFAFVTYLRTSSATASDESSSEEVNSNRNRRSKFPKKIVVLLLSLAIIHTSLQSVMDDSFSRFFVTFSLEHIRWTKTKSALAVFIFWFLNSFGNFVAIFFASYCDANTFLRIFVCMFGVSFLLFFLASQVIFEALNWASVGMMGFFMSIIFPGLMTWASDNVTHMTGKISGLFMVTAVLAGFPFPPVIGSAIEHLGPMWYVYILGVVQAICLLVFFAAQILMRIANDKWRLSHEEDEEEDIDTRTSVNVV